MLYDFAFVKKLQRGHKKSFEMLFLNTYESLCEYSVTVTKSKEDAEGVVQDVFASLWQNRDKLEETVNIKAYLFRSVKNGSLDVVQHQKIRKKYQDQLTDMYLNTGLSSVDHTNHFIKRVTEEIENLPEKCRITYLLHRRDGLTYSEIADVLDISKKAVEARMSKALKLLRERLRNEKEIHLLPLLAIFGI